ncbi:MAG: YncE family protein [Parachlamydiaceae bacterium]|nr:YncE family protein [Parachlamydiaceae bacterium]
MQKKFLIICLFGLLHFLAIHSKTYADHSNTVVATIATGVNPGGIAITPNSRTAYIANVNNYDIINEHTVSVIDLKTNLVEKTIRHPSFNEVYTITLNKQSTKAYATNSNSSTVSIINTKTNLVSGVIQGFDGPSGMVINHDKNIGYVNNYGGPDGVGSGNGNTVSIVDLNINAIVGTILVDQAPVALAISPDNKFVYVINYVDGNPGNGTLNIIQTDINQVIGTIKGFFGPFAIAITPNGKYAYITNFGSNNFDPIGTTVSVVNLKKHEIKTTISLALQPSGVAISKNGRLAYVTNYNTLYRHKNFTELTPGEGTVEIIDIASNTIIAPTIVVGNSPARITISHNGKFAYVSNFSANTVDVIALPNKARKK